MALHPVIARIIWQCLEYVPSIHFTPHSSYTLHDVSIFIIMTDLGIMKEYRIYNKKASYKIEIVTTAWNFIILVRCERTVALGCCIGTVLVVIQTPRRRESLICRVLGGMSMIREYTVIRSWWNFSLTHLHATIFRKEYSLNNISSLERFGINYGVTLLDIGGGF